MRLVFGAIMLMIHFRFPYIGIGNGRTGQKLKSKKYRKEIKRKVTNMKSQEANKGKKPLQKEVLGEAHNIYLTKNALNFNGPTYIQQKMKRKKEGILSMFSQFRYKSHLTDYKCIPTSKKLIIARYNEAQPDKLPIIPFQGNKKVTDIV